MSEFAFENLPLAIRKAADGDLYQVGVVLEGHLFVFALWKAGWFEAELAGAKAAQAEAQAAVPAAPSPEQ